MLMSPNKDETAGHGCYCPGDMTVRMREVLARPWVGECVPLTLSLSLSIWRLKSGHVARVQFQKAFYKERRHKYPAAKFRLF